jgi:hypothetical protein
MQRYTQFIHLLSLLKLGFWCDNYQRFLHGKIHSLDFGSKRLFVPLSKKVKRSVRKTTNKTETAISEK